MQASLLFVLVTLSPASALQLKKNAGPDGGGEEFAYVTMWLKKDLVPLPKFADVMTAEEELELEQANPSEKKNRAARLSVQVSEESMESDLPKGGSRRYGPSFVFDMDGKLRKAGSTKPLLVVTNDPAMIDAPELKDHPMIKIVEMGEGKNVDFVQTNVKLLARNRVHLHKLAIFSMTEYKKMIYMDLDTQVNKNIDHIFTDERFSTRDGKQVWGIVNDFSCGHHGTRYRSDFFNSAVMLFEPKKETAKDMMKFAEGKRFWGDQALIQAYYTHNKDEKGKMIKDPELRKKARIFPTKMADFMNCNENTEPLEIEHHR